MCADTSENRYMLQLICIYKTLNAVLYIYIVMRAVVIVMRAAVRRNELKNVMKRMERN